MLTPASLYILRSSLKMSIDSDMRHLRSASAAAISSGVWGPPRPPPRPPPWGAAPAAGAAPGTAAVAAAAPPGAAAAALPPPPPARPAGHVSPFHCPSGCLLPKPVIMPAFGANDGAGPRPAVGSPP